MVLSVIRAPFDRPDVLRKLRPAFEAGPIKSVMLPAACDPSGLSTSLRFVRFEVAHRGKYELCLLRDRALQRELRNFAEAICGSPLRSGALLLQRFRRGGYSLFQDDALTRIERGIELTLDLSRAARGPPAVYQLLAEKLIVPQMPGLVALVERTPDLYRYDRYLPAFVGRAQVLRLRASFRYAD
jgi:hypothetical protein